jgi:hypothetical protein
MRSVSQHAAYLRGTNVEDGGQKMMVVYLTLSDDGRNEINPET